MAAMVPERSRILHNFSLPPRLNWGTQRLLRCSKLNNNPSSSNDAVSDSPPPPASFTDRKRRNASFRSPPSPSLRRRIAEDINSNNKNKIEAVREKLVLDLCSDVDKFRTAFFKDLEIASPPHPPPIPQESRPWNLRTRRSPSTVEVSPSPVEKCVSGGGDGGRVKFSVPLSRQEIEDDFVQMIGRRPPRKPKKRHRYVQKQLDTLFPGLWLTEVSADMYKVNEYSEPPK